MTQANRILVFDSGVGGLSILDAIKQRLSGREFVYASDNAAFPYGVKSQSFLIERVDAVLKALIKQVQPDIIVVACNTASTLVLPSIRDHFKSPVVGVVPAIKPAAEQTRSGVIGLLGTPGTVAREYTQQLINEFAGSNTVVKVGSSRLVDIAELALRGITPDSTELGKILAPLFADDRLDTIVLACTHFPLIIEDLKAASPRLVNWIDSGAAIARRVESLLGTNPRGQTDSCTTNCQAIFTKASNEVAKLQAALLNFDCHSISFLEM
ncbi:MAG: glutamate racemase [Gammaproteobacteria bacterium]|nr:MAG: glutamate racemase [Gammaproteobacteria bacterium]